jgi:FAD/FMN-containing dehydrogenase
LEELVPSFAASVAGELVLKGDPSYEEARRVWNAMVDRRPALILRCRGTADVVRAVNFAREHGLPLSVRGGGHNLAGNAVCDDGLVLDLSLMKEVRVDPERRVATAQAGVTLREFDVKTQEFGLATPGGIVSGTGLAGLTLGGGFGYAMRTYGLACDNLLGLEVVTADGRVVRANARENQDLFWAARGGGGNFGVVTSLEFKLHAVGHILFGHVIYPIDRAREAFQFFRKFMEGAPDEFNGGPALLKSPEGVPVAAIGAAYFGPIQEGERILRPLREFGTPLLDEIRPTAYLSHRDGFDAYYPSGLRNYWKSCFLKDMSDEAIDMMIHHFGRTTSRRPAVAIETLGGAVARVGRDETAFDHRDAPFSLIITASWDNPAEDMAHRTWAREVFQAMQPYSTGGVYVNYLQEESDEGRARVESAYGTKYERLAALKRKYDPGNLFRFNQNIRPDR